MLSDPYWWSDKEANEKAWWATWAILIGMIILYAIGWVPEKVGIKGVIGFSAVSFFVLWPIFGIANMPWGHISLDQMKRDNERKHDQRQAMADPDWEVRNIVAQSRTDSQKAFEKRVKDSVKKYTPKTPQKVTRTRKVKKVVSEVPPGYTPYPVVERAPIKRRRI
jgi:hypothetical protein